MDSAAKLPVTVLYRYKMRNYAEETFVPFIEAHAYHVKRETKCGYWIWEHGKYGKEKFVLKNEHTPGKRFAYTTKEAALDAFIYRRRFYQGLLESRVIGNRKVIEAACNLRDGKPVADKVGYPW